MTAHINIGSNLGDRKANIAKAVALISRLSESELRISDYVESEPWGFDSDNRFLNLGVEIETSMSPVELLASLLEIESRLNASPHRDDDNSYIDRTLDIDLIYVDNLIVETGMLTLPHPRMHLRRFVLQPVNQLAPDWRHPVTGLTAAEMLDIIS